MTDHDSSHVAESQNMPADCSHHRESFWRFMDPWFWPFALSTAAAFVLLGWFHEVVFSESTFKFRNSSMPEIQRRLISLASVTGFTILLAVVYSTADYVRRLVYFFFAIVLNAGCYCLAVGCFRHQSFLEIWDKVVGKSFDVNLVGIPIGFVLGSFWLNSLIVPIKLFRNQLEARNQQVDQIYQTTRLRWWIVFGLTLLIWKCVNEGWLQSLITHLPLSTGPDLIPFFLIGLILAVGFYCFFTALAIARHRAMSVAIAIVVCLLVVWLAGNLGKSILKDSGIFPPRWESSILSTTQMGGYVFLIWFVVLYLSGRMRRIVHKTAADASKTEPKGFSSPKFLLNTPRIAVVFSFLSLLLTAHFLPYWYDVPLAIEMGGSAHKHARLLADIRWLKGQTFAQQDGSITPIVDWPNDVSQNATLDITSAELGNPRWQRSIKNWRNQNRMPRLHLTDYITSIEQLHHLGRTDFSIAIDAKEIDSKQLSRLRIPFNISGILNARIDQNWVDFFSAGENKHYFFEFYNCTFDPVLKPLADKENLTVVLNCCRIDDVVLDSIENLATYVYVLCEDISDIQLSQKALEIFIRRHSIAVEFDSVRTDLNELQNEIHQHFQRLSYSDDLIRKLFEFSQVSSFLRLKIGPIPYGDGFSLSPNMNSDSLETNDDGQVIRYTQGNKNAMDDAVSINFETLAEVESLRLGNRFLSEYANHPFQFKKLRELRFCLNWIHNIPPANIDGNLKEQVQTLLKNVDQSQLEILQIPFPLQELLADCGPWTNLKHLEVVLEAQPADEVLAQIKTAAQLETLRICDPTIGSFPYYSEEQEKQMWVDQLEQAGITVPTTVVSNFEDLESNTNVPSSTEAK